MQLQEVNTLNERAPKTVTVMPPLRTGSSREAPTDPISRLEGLRGGIQQLFSGRSYIGIKTHSPQHSKSARPGQELHQQAASRRVIPRFGLLATRTPSHRSEANSERGANGSSHSQTMQRPAHSAPPQYGHRRPGRPQVGVDPSEQALAAMADSGRRSCRGRKHSERACAPKMKNKKIRSKARSCIFSGTVCSPSYI